jgi:GNAT superfamily N-acetyltransferase
MSTENTAAAPAATMRRATREDLPAIVALLADDHLGARRESPDDLTPYEDPFTRIAEDPNQHLTVAEHDGDILGTLQLTLIPGLSRQGATRALIEAVRVHTDARGTGLGTRLIEWAIDEARRQGCSLIQLTSDATRVGAHRFYERLGFEASHLGFKMPLT